MPPLVNANLLTLMGPIRTRRQFSAGHFLSRAIFVGGSHFGEAVLPHQVAKRAGVMPRRCEAPIGSSRPVRAPAYQVQFHGTQVLVEVEAIGHSRGLGKDPRRAGPRAGARAGRLVGLEGHRALDHVPSSRTLPGQPWRTAAAWLARDLDHVLPISWLKRRRKLSARSGCPRAAPAAGAGGLGSRSACRRGPRAAGPRVQGRQGPVVAATSARPPPSPRWRPRGGSSFPERAQAASPAWPAASRPLSRNSVPRCAASKSPFLFWCASLKAPFMWPKSSLSSRFSAGPRN